MRKTRKLLACVLALVMLLSMFGMASAAGTVTDGIKDSNGTIQNDGTALQYDMTGLAKKRGADLSEVRGVAFTIQVDDVNSGFGGSFIWNSGVDGYNWNYVGWGLSADGTDYVVAESTGTDGEYTVTRTSDAAVFDSSASYNSVWLTSEGTSSFTITKVDALDADGAVLFTSEDTSVDLENVLKVETYDPATGFSGLLDWFEAYDFTEEDVKLRITTTKIVDYSSRDGHNFGAINDSASSVWTESLYYAVPSGNNGSTRTQEWTLADIGAQFTAAGGDANNGLYFNVWGWNEDSEATETYMYATITKIELVATTTLEIEDVYTQTAEDENSETWSLRFVEVISDETADTHINVNYKVYVTMPDATEETLLADANSVYYYGKISIGGDPIEAPEGYGFLAYAVTGIPNDLKDEYEAGTLKLRCEITLTPISES